MNNNHFSLAVFTYKNPTLQELSDILDPFKGTKFDSYVIGGVYSFKYHRSTKKLTPTSRFFETTDKEYSKYAYEYNYIMEHGSESNKQELLNIFPTANDYAKKMGNKITDAFICLDGTHWLRSDNNEEYDAVFMSYVECCKKLNAFVTIIDCTVSN